MAGYHGLGTFETFLLGSVDMHGAVVLDVTTRLTWIRSLFLEVTPNFRVLGKFSEQSLPP